MPDRAPGTRCFEGLLAHQPVTALMAGTSWSAITWCPATVGWDSQPRLVVLWVNYRKWMRVSPAAVRPLTMLWSAVRQAAVWSMGPMVQKTWAVG